MDSQNNLYVVSTGTNEIFKFAANSGTISGGIASLPFLTISASSSPTATVIDALGNLYIGTGSGSDSILKYAASGGVPGTSGTTIGAGFNTISDIWIASDGKAYISDNGANKLYQFASMASATSPANALASASINFSSQIYIDSSNNLYVLSTVDAGYNPDSGKVIKFPAVGGVVSLDSPADFITGLNSPTAITGDSAGNIYVGDGDEFGGGDGHLYKFGSSGGLVADGTLEHTFIGKVPTELLLDDGVLYATVSDGTVAKIILGSPNTPPSIGGAVASQAVNDTATISPFGTLTIADANNNNVSVTITLDTAAKGAFTPASLTASGFVDATGGSYTLASTTTSAAQAAIRQLVFDPANNRVAVGSTETTTFTIVVNDGTVTTQNTSTTVVSSSINDAPTDIALANSSVNQSGGANALVGTLWSTDPDPGSSFTYMLASGTGDTHNALFNISGNSLRANDAAAMAQGSYSVRLQTNDGIGGIYQESFTITVNDNVAPVFDETTPSTANLAATTLDLTASLNEAGTIYYVVVADGAGAPSAAQIKAGQNATGTAAFKSGNAGVAGGAFTHTFNLTGLTAETAYDIYVVGEDDEGTPNTMAAPVKLDVTTPQAGPSVTDAHISITSTPTGTSSTYKIGDTVTAQWDNSASGQNQAGVTVVTMDFSAFGGGTAVVATETTPGSGIWSASYLLGSGSIDTSNRNVSVSATNGNGTTTTPDTTNLTVDNQAPTVDDANLSISGASGTGGAYKIGDTVTATWNNTGTGDNNNDIASVTADFSAFGGASAVTATNSGGTWTASYTILAGNIDATNQNVSLTVTDDAGNVTSRADTSNATVDTQAPTVTAARISVSGATGTGGVFKVGDTVTATWKNSASGGDSNADTISGVTMNFSQFGGGAAVAATHSGGIWTATYTIVAGSIDNQNNRNVSVTATDNVGNTTTVAGADNVTVDNQPPSAPGAPDLAAASDSGSSDTDNLTGDTTPTLSGVDAVASSTVTIISSLVGTLGTATADGSGHWSFTPGTPLAAGTHSITATTSDAAGNVSAASSALSISIDTSPPAISSVSIPNSAMKIDDVVTATITVASDSDTYTLSSGSIGGFTLGSLTKTSATSYTATFTVSAGGSDVAAGNDIPVSLVFTDTAGNSNTAYTTAISQNADAINAHAPTDIALSNNTVSTAASIGAVVGTLSSTDATPAETFTYTLVAGAGDTDNTSFSIVGDELRANTPSALVAGDKAIRVQTTDAAGNSYIEQMTVTVSTNPTVTLSLDDSTLLAGETATLTLTFSEPPVGFDIGDITVSGGSLSHLAVDALNNKIYTATFTPTVGAQSLNGSLSIAAGSFKNASDQQNLPSNSVTLTGDTLRPTVTSIERQTPTAEQTNADSLTYRISFSEAVAHLDTSDFTVSGTTATVSQLTSVGGNAYDITISGGNLASLDATVTLDFAAAQNITDSAGNALTVTAASATSQRIYLVDNTAPALNAAGSSPADNATNIAVNSALTLKFAEALGANSDLTKVYLKDAATDTLVPATITLSGSGDLVITPTGSLAYSTAYYVTWDANALKDAAGNAAAAVSDETTFNFTTSATPPPPPPPGDDDEDGIPGEEEDDVPGIPSQPGGPVVAGDGNGDGIKDSEQPQVTSLHLRETTHITNDPAAPTTPVTLVAGSQDGKVDPNAGTVKITRIEQQDAPDNLPEGFTAPLGLLSFTALVDTAGGTQSFSFFLDEKLDINGYFKQNANGTWVNLADPANGGRVITEHGKIRLDFLIQDGGEFDADGKADGVITDPGAPGKLLLPPPPGTNCPFDPFKPDADGDGLPDALEAGFGLNAALKDNNVFADTNLFVYQLYRDLLGREGEAEGVAHWIAGMGQEWNRAELVAKFVDSPEFDMHAGAVARLYHATLGRSPDYCGFNFWLGERLAGRSLESVAQAFLNSTEFAGRNPALSNNDFIDLLYQNVLGRPADAQGKSFWLSQLEQGQSRAQLLHGFTQSAEYKAAMADEVAIDLLYLGLLDRGHDQPGWDHWHARWSSFESVTHFYEVAMAEPEYQGRFLPAQLELTGVSHTEPGGPHL